MILPARPVVSLFAVLGLAACASPPPPVEAPTLPGPAARAQAEPAQASAGGNSGIVADASATPTASEAASEERATDEPADEPDFDAGALAALTGLVGRAPPQLDGGIIFGSGTLTTGWGPGSGGGFGSGVHVGSGLVGSTDAGAAVSATLSAEQIRRVVVAHIGALRACYEIEAQKDATLSGKIILSWRIDPTGSVPSARVSSTTMNSARVEACLLRQVRSWKFPQSSAGASATFPFVFGTH